MDARAKKDEHFENKNCYLGSIFFFNFLNVHPLSPGGFFTFLIALAHGVAGAIYFTGKYNRIAEKERDNLLIHPFRFLVVTPILNCLNVLSYINPLQDWQKRERAKEQSNLQ